jgi:NADH-ubiquinone oxidoreductase chain 6
MNNYNVAYEFLTSGQQLVALDLVSWSSILFGIFVIVTRNPIISVLFLIGLFLSIAGYLMLIGVHFIGLSYLLVYVGAVSILFLFILMLINVRLSELHSSSRNNIPLGFIVAIAFSYIIIDFTSSPKSNTLSTGNIEIDYLSSSTR